MSLYPLVVHGYEDSKIKKKPIMLKRKNSMRNQKCLYGSGLKTKKCCWNKMF